MIAKRPTILIYTLRPDPALLREICAGIEEEGVLYECIAQPAGEAYTLANMAASASMLGSGVGLRESAGALYMRGGAQAVAVTRSELLTPEMARAMGQNSARIIKKLPLRLDDPAGI